MRNSAGFAPLPLPQFAWSSVDKRRTTRTSMPPEAADPPTLNETDSHPGSAPDAAGEERN